MHIICTAFSHGQVTCQAGPSSSLPRLPWPVTASQVSMAGNSSSGGWKEERSATVSRRKTKVKCHVYVMLPYSSCSSLFCCALYFISPFVCLFLFSLTFWCVLRFCFYLFGNISLTLTFRTVLWWTPATGRADAVSARGAPCSPTSSLGLAPTRRFMTFTFMTGICVCLCACVCVCPFSCMQAWKAAEILICYFIAYTQRVLRCMIYGLWLTRALLIATE